MTKKELREEVIKNIVFGLESMKDDITNNYNHVLVDDAHTTVGRMHLASFLGAIKTEEFTTLNHKIWDIAYPEKGANQLDMINELISTVGSWS